MTTYHDIKGWFNYHPFYEMLLEETPETGTVVEVGVFYGKGLVYLAHHAPLLRIYGVDRFCFNHMPYQDQDVTDDDDFYERCLKNLFAAEVERFVTLVCLPSVRASKLFADASLDCAFIDADHREDPVAADIEAWLPKVRPGGFLAGDDYTPDFEGVINAVDRLLPQRQIMGQTWWLRV